MLFGGIIRNIQICETVRYATSRKLPKNKLNNCATHTFTVERYFNIAIRRITINSLRLAHLSIFRKTHFVPMRGGHKYEHYSHICKCEYSVQREGIKKKNFKRVSFSVHSNEYFSRVLLPHTRSIAFHKRH